MVAALAFASRWFLGGGWKLVLIGAAILSGFLFYRHYENLEAEAALVPGLQETIASNNKRANALAEKLQQIELARTKADAELSAWQGIKAELFTTLRASNRNAAANTNPACYPSESDRQLWNDTIARALGSGQAGSNGSVPNAPIAPY